MSDEFLYEEVFATVLGPNFDVNLKFAKTTPFASPFIYFQTDSSAQPFAVVDRAWKRILFFNVEGMGKLAVSLLERWFLQHSIFYFTNFALQGEATALSFVSQLCLTGIETNLPLNVILEQDLDLVSIAKPRHNQRHILQRFGYTFVDAPIGTSSLCGNFFGEPFNVTNHVMIFLQLKRECKSLEIEDIERLKGAVFEAKFSWQLVRFKEFALLVEELYLHEPLLFNVIYETPRHLKLGRYKTGIHILGKLDRAEILRLARIIFLKNLDVSGRLKI